MDEGGFFLRVGTIAHSPPFTGRNHCEAVQVRICVCIYGCPSPIGVMKNSTRITNDPTIICGQEYCGLEVGLRGGIGRCKPVPSTVMKNQAISESPPLRRGDHHQALQV